MKTQNPSDARNVTAGDLGDLLAYSRIAFDRAYGHIVALSARFNLIAATSSVLLLAFITVGLNPEIIKVCSTVTRSCVTLALLCVAVIACVAGIFFLSVSIWACMRSVFMTVKPKSCHPFFPPVEVPDERLLKEIEYYVERAELELEERQHLVERAAKYVRAGLLSFVVLLAALVFIALNECT